MCEKPVKLRLILSLIASLLTMFLCIPIGNAQPRSFSVDPAPTGEDLVIITIDASNVPANLYFEDVNVTIGFYDGDEEPTPAQQPTETQKIFLGHVGGGAVVRLQRSYSRPAHAFVWLSGQKLSYKSGVEGGKYDTASAASARNASRAFRLVAQGAITSPTSLLTGIWSFKMVSSVSHKIYAGHIRLVQDSSSLSGGFVEDLFGNTERHVRGTITNSVIELSRDTGLETIQRFRLTKQTDNKFAGDFWNDGKWFDKGSIEIERRE